MSINSHVVKSTIVGSLGGLLFGFDTAVISGTTHALTLHYHLSPFMLGVTVSSALIGTVIGAITGGIPGQRFGRRNSLRVMAIFYVISALGCAFAWNLPSLIAFRVIGGLGIGGSSVLGPMYIAEVSPPDWRGRLVGFFQVNIVIGILLAYISNALISSMIGGASDWRWMFGVSGIPAALFLIALFGIPLSPRWLAMKARLEESLKVLRLIGTPDPQKELDEILSTINLEQSAKSEPLFCRKYLKPVILAITVGMFCQLSGINAILYYLNDIFSLAGIKGVSGDLQAIAVGAVNLVATLVAMSVIDKVGRRVLLLIGSVGMAVCLALIAAAFSTHSYLGSLVWLLMIYIAFFAISIGAVVWVYISEVFPNRVRSKGQSLGASSHWITNTIISLVFPMMAASSGALPFIFFAVMMVIFFFVVFFYYPETSNISLEQMQHRFGID